MLESSLVIRRSNYFQFTDLIKSCIMKQFTFFSFTGERGVGGWVGVGWGLGGEGFQLGNDGH